MALPCLKRILYFNVKGHFGCASGNVEKRCPMYTFSRCGYIRFVRTYISISNVIFLSNRSTVPPTHHPLRSNQVITEWVIRDEMYGRRDGEAVFYPRDL